MFILQEWSQKYENLTDMIVPRSSRLVFEDHENALFSVTLFRKVVEEFKVHCRESKSVADDWHRKRSTDSSCATSSTTRRR